MPADPRPGEPLRWLRLDNAAKIYPAARRENWSNVFRLSVTLDHRVDKAVLQSALDVTVRRFPSIATRLRRGLFWYYLQQLENAPQVLEDYAHPLTQMTRREVRRCAFRVLVYENRIAVELFHALTDGNGGLIFLKSLTAEYLHQKFGISISATNGVLDRQAAPEEQELEDSFQKYAGDLQASRRETTAWHLGGTLEETGFLHVTCFQLPVAAVVEKAHQYGVTVTAYLCAVMLDALQRLQEAQVPDRRQRKPLKVLLPVNLRQLFPSKSLRNFALYTIPELTPRLGHYEFSEICRLVRHRMGMDVTPKHMSTMIATNIGSERMLAVRLVPLFLKNIIMKAVFDSVGEKKSCLSLSNLGTVTVPPEMTAYVKRFDFVLGVQATAPYNCGVLSYGDTLYASFIRNIREPTLEAAFHQALQVQGISTKVESNG